MSIDVHALQPGMMMKSRTRRSYLLSLSSALLAVFAMTTAVAQDDAQLEQVRQKVSDMFDLIDPENVQHRRGHRLG